jgi:hypothetical protein
MEEKEEMLSPEHGEVKPIKNDNPGPPFLNTNNSRQKYLEDLIDFRR